MSSNQAIKKKSLQTIDGLPIEIPKEGSLGLLALGYQGLVAWRNKRKEINYDFSEHLQIQKPIKENNGKTNCQKKYYLLDGMQPTGKRSIH